MMVLYELLQVKQTATQAEIRKAYLVLAKKLHPDKLQDNEKDGGKAFLQLKKAYDILSNPQSRARYDLTGDVESSEETVSFQEAYERFRGVQVTEQDIEQVEREYRNSEDEARDLEEFFTERCGDVRLVLAFVIGSRAEDLPRYVEMWEEGLRTGKLNKRFRKEFNKAKTEFVTDLDEMSEDEEEDDDDDMEEEEDYGFLVQESEEEEEEEEEEEASVAMQFTPGDDVQVKHHGEWANAFVLSNKRGKYDVQLVPSKEPLKNIDPALVRSKPEPAKRLKPSPNEEDGVDPALAALLQSRNKARQQDMVSQLEAKYSNKQKKKRG